jgi:hypothetical protein
MGVSAYGFTMRVSLRRGKRCLHLKLLNQGGPTKAKERAGPYTSHDRNDERAQNFNVAASMKHTVWGGEHKSSLEDITKMYNVHYEISLPGWKYCLVIPRCQRIALYQCHERCCETAGIGNTTEKSVVGKPICDTHFLSKCIVCNSAYPTGLDADLYGLKKPTQYPGQDRWVFSLASQRWPLPFLKTRQQSANISFLNLARHYADQKGWSFPWPCHEGTRRSRGISPLILNLGIRWK